MQRFVHHIFVYYDLPLPIGSDEIIEMSLNNPQCGHKDVQNFPILVRYPSRQVLPYVHTSVYPKFPFLSLSD